MSKLRAEICTGVDVIHKGIGSLQAGKLHAHVATSGDGKTTLALQLLCETARRSLDANTGEISYYFNFEHDLDIPRKLESAARRSGRDLQLPKSSDRDGHVDQDEVQFAFNKVVQISYRDQPDKGDKLKYMSSRIDAHQIKSETPGVAIIIVDGLSEIAEEMGARSYRYMHLETILRTLGTMARKFDCPIWITYQLAGKENRRSRFKLPNPQATDGWKKFWSSKLIESGLVSGKLIDSCAAFVPLIGSRRGAPFFARIWKDCANWTLEDVDHLRVVGNKIIDSRGSLHSASELEDHTIGSDGFIDSGRRGDVRKLPTTEPLKLEPAAQYWLLAESDRMRGSLCKLTLMGGHGAYLWQTTGSRPWFGFWHATTHNNIRSLKAQIRTIREFAYKPTTQTKSQEWADKSVLRSLAHRGPQRITWLQKNANLGSHQRTRCAVDRLRNLGLVDIDRAAQIGLRTPTDSEFARSRSRSPYQPASKRAKPMTDDDAMKCILAQVREIGRTLRRATSLCELGRRLPISKSRLNVLLDECVIRELLKKSARGRWRYSISR